MENNMHFLDYAGLQQVWNKVKEKDSLITQVFGYYFNGAFYEDSSYTEAKKITPSEKHIYLNKNERGKTSESEDYGILGIYYYDGTKYIRCVQDATGNIPGILKLYTTHGNNEDGTMTQKAITDGVNRIKFALDQSEPECLVLGLPWD